MSDLVEHMVAQITKLSKAEQQAIAAEIQKRLAEADKNERPSIPAIGIWF